MSPDPKRLVAESPVPDSHPPCNPISQNSDDDGTATASHAGLLALGGGDMSLRASSAQWALEALGQGWDLMSQDQRDSCLDSLEELAIESTRYILLQKDENGMDREEVIRYFEELQRLTERTLSRSRRLASRNMSEQSSQGKAAYMKMAREFAAETLRGELQSIRKELSGQDPSKMTEAERKIHSDGMANLCSVENGLAAIL